MSTIYTSSARLAYVDGIHVQSLMILISDPQVFHALPGKFERLGVKTLSSWPIYVTAVLNDPQPEETLTLTGSTHSVREAAAQLAFIDPIKPQSTGTKAHRHRVEKTLAEIRKLHEELNAALYSSPTERPAIHSPADIYEILSPFMGPLDHEELWVIILDTRNRVMGLSALYRGSVNSSQVRVAEVFRQAVVDNAPSIIVAHNHPSNDPSPSPDDVAVTRAMIQAGKLLDIELLDHLIVCRSSYVSLKERGLAFGQGV